MITFGNFEAHSPVCVKAAVTTPEIVQVHCDSDGPLVRHSATYSFPSLQPSNVVVQ